MHLSRPRAVAAVGVAAVCVAGLTAAAATADAETASSSVTASLAALSDPSSAEAPVAAASTLTWSDEFDGAAGTPPDPAKWGYDLGGEGWGNAELQSYTDSTDNAAHDGDGHLVITAREAEAGLDCWYGPCEYTSARLLTKGTFTQAYGRFEARLKIPAGQGIWPAFWMLGDDIDAVGWPASGEIDIMENIGREPGMVHGTLHGPGYSGGGGVGAAYLHPDGGAFADDFHTYAVDWSPTEITWSVDGVEYSTKTPADVSGDWVYDHPFFLIMNVAVGGTWPGSPDASTVFPQEMVIDHVRVYAEPGTPTDEPTTPETTVPETTVPETPTTVADPDTPTPTTGMPDGTADPDACPPKD
ncbi:MAG: glycoside hydrolase family 16 protein [Actinomycetota bacterium]|nr:glycoside hydrolase family 16 protein [Actinomycetota bacterium]